jgi:hypothetical protein
MALFPLLSRRVRTFGRRLDIALTGAEHDMPVGIGGLAVDRAVGSEGPTLPAIAAESSGQTIRLANLSLGGMIRCKSF